MPCLTYIFLAYFLQDSADEGPVTYECATTKDASAHTSCKLCDADIAYLLANTTWNEIGMSTNEVKFAQ